MCILAAVIGRLGGEAGRESAEEARADQETVQRMARHDADALVHLYDRHARAIYSFALHIVREQAEAEDVVQEVLSQAWRQAARYDSKRGSVAAWLLTMTRSRAIDRLRNERARPDSEQADDGQLRGLVDPAEPQDRRLSTRDQMIRLRSAMARLPVMQRVVIELAYFGGLSQSEIAERLDEPIGTVKTRVRLGLLKLREAMAESGI
jgi:RNA polymerase sigma-70 factor (ECF subfamily)